MELRRATLADAPAIVALVDRVARREFLAEGEAAVDRWIARNVDPAAIAADVEDARVEVWVAEVDGRLEATATFRLRPDGVLYAGGFYAERSGSGAQRLGLRCFAAAERLGASAILCEIADGGVMLHLCRKYGFELVEAYDDDLFGGRWLRMRHDGPFGHRDPLAP